MYQKEDICIWVKVNPNNEYEFRDFYVLGTGWGFDYGNLKYINSVMLDNGNLVFHIFESLGD